MTISISLWPCIPKPWPGFTRILVDHPQGTKAHLGRVVVSIERKSMPRIEPVILGMASLGCLAHTDHDSSPQRFNAQRALRATLGKFGDEFERVSIPYVGYRLSFLIWEAHRQGMIVLTGATCPYRFITDSTSSKSHV